MQSFGQFFLPFRFFMLSLLSWWRILSSRHYSVRKSRRYHLGLCPYTKYFVPPCTTTACIAHTTPPGRLFCFSKPNYAANKDGDSHRTARLRKAQLAVDEICPTRPSFIRHSWYTRCCGDAQPFLEYRIVPSGRGMTPTLVDMTN